MHTLPLSPHLYYATIQLTFFLITLLLFFSSNPRPFVSSFSSNFINFSSLHFSPSRHLLCLLVFILTEPTLPLLSSPYIFQLVLFFFYFFISFNFVPSHPGSSTTLLASPLPLWIIIIILLPFSLPLSLSFVTVYNSGFTTKLFLSLSVSLCFHSLSPPPPFSLSLPLSAHCQATTAQTVQLQLFQAQ